MLGALLAGLILCPALTSPDGGVVTIEPGPQWTLSDGVECEQSTVISPDTGPRMQAVMKPQPPTGVSSQINERVKGHPVATQGPEIPSNCRTTYRASSVLLEFSPSKEELTATVKAGLIELLSQSPQGVNIVSYLGDEKPDKQFVDRLVRRVNGVEVLAKALAGPRAIVSRNQGELQRGARVSGAIEVIGIFVSACGQQTTRTGLSPQNLSLSSSEPNQGRQGGIVVAQ